MIFGGKISMKLRRSIIDLYVKDNLYYLVCFKYSLGYVFDRNSPPDKTIGGRF